MIARHVDTALGFLKWPLGILSLAALPGLLRALGGLLGQIVDEPAPLWPFLGGVAAYVAADRLILRRRLVGSSLSTLEHELTHAVFAWLTFHRVRGLRVTWSRGGSIQVLGGGNWLIALAPYFFPTLSVAIAIALAWIPAEHRRIANVLLGASLAYHLISTWRETHFGQEDLKVAGRVFSVIFLPGAAVLWNGGILALAAGRLGWMLRESGALYGL